MAQIHLNLLGGFECLVDRQFAAHFRSNNARGLLVFLALEADRPHQRRSLAALLWPDQSEADGLRRLRKAIYELRLAVDKQIPQLSRELLAVDQQTIQLNSASMALDVACFEGLLAQIARHDHAELHLCPDCLQRLAAAVNLHRGDLLQGFALENSDRFDEWLLYQRQALHQELVQALQILTDAYEKRAELEPAEKYTLRVLALDPYDEEAYRRRMRIQARSGRRGAALETFERLAAILQAELGVSPEPDTVALRQQIQQAAAAPQVGQQHYFPSPSAPFIGRQRELNLLSDYLQDSRVRLITLLGPGGTGKSRLAGEAATKDAVATRFVDGIFFINLEETLTVSGLAAAIVDALGLMVGGQATPEEQALDFLRNKSCLLVLDNLEQLEGGFDLLARLLDEAPGVAFIATSRRPLRLRTERQVRIGGLILPPYPEDVQAYWNDPQAPAFEAIRLFVHAAQMVQPEFAVTDDNFSMLVRICRAVNGLPLALQMAASWVRLMGPAEIAATVASSPDFLVSPLRDIPDRHRSMTTIFDHSWKMLTPREQTALAQLSIFQGSFSLNAALKVTGATIQQLMALLDQSLLRRTDEGRYDLHLLLRQYAAQRLAGMNSEGGVEARTRASYCDHYLTLLAAAVSEFQGAQPLRAVTLIRERMADIQRAWQVAIELDSFPLPLPTLRAAANALGFYYEFLGRFHEGLSQIAHLAAGLLARPDHQESTPVSLLLSHLLTWRAQFEHSLSEGDAVFVTMAQALSHAGADAAALANVKSFQGKILPDRGQFEQAHSVLTEARAYFEHVGDRSALAEALDRLGFSKWREGDYPRAVSFLKEALTLQRRLGNKRAQAALLGSLAGICYEKNEWAESQTYAQQSHRLYEEIEDENGLARTASNLSILFQISGQFEQALTYNQLYLEQQEAVGNRRHKAFALGNRATVFQELGDFPAAQRCFLQAIALFEVVGFAWGTAYQQAGLASSLFVAGDFQRASALLEQCIPVLREHGTDFYLVTPLLRKAEIELAEQRLPEVEALLQELFPLTEKLAIPENRLAVQILAARLRHARGDATAAKQRLADLLARSTDPGARAELHFAMWRMFGEQAHARAARDTYQQLHAQVPKYSFRQKLDALRADGV